MKVTASKSFRKQFNKLQDGEKRKFKKTPKLIS